MNRLFTAFLFCALMLNPLTSDASTVIASASMQITGMAADLNIEKCSDDQGISLKISAADGKVLLESGVLGSQDKLFAVGSDATGLTTHDFDGDGTAEVVASAFYGPKASALYVFRYDAAAGKFVPIKFLNSSDPELSTDFMVSDMEQADGQDMVINADHSIVALGMIYPANAEDVPTPGLYTYKLVEGQFKLTEKKPVPAAN